MRRIRFTLLGVCLGTLWAVVGCPQDGRSEQGWVLVACPTADPRAACAAILGRGGKVKVYVTHTDCSVDVPAQHVVSGVSGLRFTCIPRSEVYPRPRTP